MLTPTEADTVRGPSAMDPLAALDPVEAPDGIRWMLPLAVLDDPAHMLHRDFLEKLPQEDVQPPEARIELPDEPPKRRKRIRLKL